MNKNNKLSWYSIASAAVLLGVGTGCSENTDSENITTQGIWAKMEVEGRQDGTSRVTVELNVGGELGTNVVLSENEYLEVSAGGQTKRMSEDQDLLDVDYQAYFDTNESEVEFNVRFFRSNGETIDNSTGVLPNNFSITTPQSEMIFSRQQVMDVAWVNEQETQSIEFLTSMSCEDTQGASVTVIDSILVSDIGTYSYTIDDHSIFDRQGVPLDPTKQCDFYLQLKRKSVGSIDPQFSSGGRFNLRQVRTVDGIKVNL